jgi:hypothetical protein
MLYQRSSQHGYHALRSQAQTSYFLVSGNVRIVNLGTPFVHDASHLIHGENYARDAVLTLGYAAPKLVSSALCEVGVWIAPGSRCLCYGLED